ncbi:dipeptide-binding protein [Pyrococcus furiosus DSM 3638]|uniref:Dipeptide-binding protein n=1 Tax=Pyrococcus furiosus (strain ATCC 43587 / DSM 3638 / JCM 8422 / Vc1) TaxID=186497 RepID=Q8U3U8_PYRFU|nr:ABC transporter substrate-binding protein [Pyrococcus furiosus]AAL80481.1 dipeptide-binding protein [Pyrococcus furiosus DSM 3638]
MKKYLATVLVAALVLSNLGVVLAAEELPREETLYTANSSPPTNANPLQGSNIIPIAGLVFEPLFMLNFMKTELIPWLADYGKWVNNNVFEVKLREGTKWQDGKSLTANDVKFSFEYYEKVGLKDWSRYGLTEIKVVDDRTVQFVFSGTPNVWAWRNELYSVLILPEHIFKDLDPQQVTQMTFLGAEQKYLVGSGAYKLYKVVEQQKAIFVRNDDWWGAKYFGLPSPKYIVQLYVGSNDQAANMFLKGDLDVGTYYVDIVELKKQNPYIVSWLDRPPYFPPVVPVIMYFNVKHKPLDNLLVRKAIAEAICPSQIVKQGPISDLPDQTPLGNVMKPWKEKIGVSQLIEKYGWKYCNPSEAAELLDQAGIKDIDGDGIREYNGQDLVLTFAACGVCSDWMQAVEIVVNQLKAVGIKVDVKKYDWGTMVSKQQAGEFDLTMHWAGTFKPDPYSVYYDLLYYYKSDQEKGGANFGNYYNSKANELLDELAKTPDEAKQVQLLAELTKIWLQDIPAVPLYMGTLFYEANTQYWANWPNEDNPYGVPIFWPGFGTWGTALAFLGVRPAKAVSPTTSTVIQEKTETVTQEKTKTVVQTVTVTQTPTETATSPTETEGICGPAILVGLAVVPLLLRRRRR